MFRVFVNSIGNVYSSEDYPECLEVFDKYKSFSGGKMGIFSNRDVFLYADPISEGDDKKYIVLKEFVKDCMCNNLDSASDFDFNMERFLSRTSNGQGGNGAFRYEHSGVSKFYMVKDGITTVIAEYIGRSVVFHQTALHELKINMAKTLDLIENMNLNFSIKSTTTD